MNSRYQKSDKSILKIIAVIAVVVVLSIVGIFTYNAYNQVQKNNDEILSNVSEGTAVGSNIITYNGKNYKCKSSLENVLFLGIDTKDTIELHTSGYSGQSDCIVLLSTDKKTNTSVLLQISRDCMTEVDLYDSKGNRYGSVHSQIATQYAYGDGKDLSLWATKKAVSRLLYNLPIDGGIAVNIESIPIVNDALGGVTVKMENNYTNIDETFVKGESVKLLGQKSEKFVRYRDTSVTGSNNDRMYRQTQYLREFIKVFQSKIDTTEKIKSLYSMVSPYMVTDISVEQMERISKSNVSVDNALYVPGQVVQGEVYDEFHVDEEKLKELLVSNFYDEI